MFETLRNAWKVQDLRKKILYTVMIILIFRIGSYIPVPFIDPAALGNAFNSTNEATNDFFNYISVLTGGGLEYGAIFAMSVTPYINSSIIMQLLSVAIPPLQRLSEDGERGRKKIAALTRYATVILGLIQGTAYFFWLKGSGYLLGDFASGFALWFAGFTIVLCFTAGSAVMMWLGERIDEKGIGNGISILLFAGILSRAPSAAATLWGMLANGQFIEALLIVAVFVVVIGFIVFMTGAERKVPVQYAKRVVGRKVYGGQNSHIPIQVNMSGVMPIIFASSFLSIPTMILGFMGNNTDSFWYKVCEPFSFRGGFYMLLYFLMIIGFAYFYVTIQYNPVEMANNLRKNNGAVPGIRPGKPTADFLKKILSRITLIGALFLSVIALLPVVMGNVASVNLTIGGTSILIVVGVAIDTVKNLESQLIMRNYKGFLD